MERPLTDNWVEGCRFIKGLGMRNGTKISWFLFLVSSLLLVACEPIEDKFWDCVDQDGPRFVSKSLPAATLGQPYSAEIKAFITREASDNRYIYDFSWSGELPLGLSVSEGPGGRALTIRGTPLADDPFDANTQTDAKQTDANTGESWSEYTLLVTVRVYDPNGQASFDVLDDDYDDGDNLCKSTYSHRFSLRLNAL